MRDSERTGRNRVALVHDFLLDVRGAERVFEAICNVWPDADVFTAVYDEEGTEGRFAHRRIHTSFLQRLRPTARTFRALLPLYPYAVEAFDLREYDLVISSASAWAHGVIVDERGRPRVLLPQPLPVCLERPRGDAGRPRPAHARRAEGLFNRWRQWDWIAAQRVDRYLANSETTRRRIKRYYGRDATVLHPPIDLGRFAPGKSVGDYHLVVSELMPHKRINVAIDAFNRLRRPLVVVGDGPDARRLRRMAGPTIRFEGRVPDARVAELLESCRALVVTATEEFGIAAVEAQAAGRPVVALAEGGAHETVREGETGILYSPDDPGALASAIAGFDSLGVDSEACVANAARFGTDRFRDGLSGAVDETVESAPAPHRARRRAAPRRPPRLLVRS